MSSPPTQQPSAPSAPPRRSHSLPTTVAAAASVSPFGSGAREDFPDFDEAFGVADRGVGQRTRRRRRTQPPDELDQSVSSIASSLPTTNSSLDMSIGARAALNEHLRHIARYGLDGKPPNQQQDDAPPTRYRNPLDEEWNNLLEGGQQQLNIHDESFSSATRQLATNESIESTMHSKTHLQPIMSMSEDGLEAIEVMTDLSTDFFNSSRVHLLSTPEKNKDTIRAVVTRDDTTSHDFDDDEDAYDEAGYQEELVSSASGAASLPSEVDSSTARIQLFREDVNATFLSAVDLSRISGSDSSEAIRRSPDDSFLNQHQMNEEAFSLSPINTIERESFRNERPFIAQHNRQRTPSPFQRTRVRRRKQKQRGLEETGSVIAALPLEALSLSPIAHKAGSAAARYLEQHDERLETIAGSFDRAYKLPLDTSLNSSGSGSGGDGHSSPPRIPRRPMSSSFDIPLPLPPPSLSRKHPPSNTATTAAAVGFGTLGSTLNSSRSSEKSSLSTSSGKTGTRHRQSPNGSPLSDGAATAAAAARSSDPSSHPSSSLTNTSSSSSIDRRQFRTVVPSRVFLIEPAEFLIQEDSFAAPWREDAETEEGPNQVPTNQQSVHRLDDDEQDKEHRTAQS